MRAKSLLGCIIASIVGLALAVWLVPNVLIEGETLQFIKTLLLAGIALGLINFFIKPVIKVVAFPLKFVTFGLVGFIINIAIVWGVDILFPKLRLEGFLALFLTSLLIWAVNLFVPKKGKSQRYRKRSEKP